MHRTFEEVGVAIDGVGYGHFTGEVQFDPDGSVAIIDIERSGFQGPPLRLDLDTLLSERSRLRNKYGMAFMTDYPGDDVRSHRPAVRTLPGSRHAGMTPSGIPASAPGR